MNRYLISLAAVAAALVSSCSSGSKVADNGVEETEPVSGDYENQTIEAGPPPEQCSRETVASGDSYFIPSMSEAEKFETILTKELKSGKRHGVDYFAEIAERARVKSLTLEDNWDRRYTGIVRKGRRSIYGEFTPVWDGKGPGRFSVGPWDTSIICDGGPILFGAEFDLQDAKVTFISFNGE